MKVEIREEQAALRVLIECRQVTGEVERLKSHIEMFDNRIQAKKEDGVCFVEAKEVLYFESVDDRMFLYTETEVMEIKQRLYELEMLLPCEDFLRISKSRIVNINKISRLQPQINRTLMATMCNGEQLYISRKYVKELKNLLAM